MTRGSNSLVLELFLLALLLGGCGSGASQTGGGSVGTASDGTAAGLLASGELSPQHLTAAQQAALEARPAMRVAWDHDTDVPRSLRKINAASPGEALEQLKDLFRIGDVARDLSLVSTEDGHSRYQQRYNGLRVVGGTVVVHAGADGVYEISASYKTGISLPTSPGVSADDALAACWKDRGGAEGQTVASGPELVVIPIGPSDYALAWEAVLVGENARWFYYVDAGGGGVLKRYNAVKHNSVPFPSDNGVTVSLTGSRLTEEGGAVATVTGFQDNTNAAFYMYSSTLRAIIFNAATSGWSDNNTYAHRHLVDGTDWGTSDRQEISAALNLQLVQNFWINTIGRNSYNNAGAVMQANIHDPAVAGNAQWNGTSMQFGDGDNVASRDFAVLDIVGHEYGHAVNETSANLTYADESGALDESFADIFGTIVEFQNQPDNSGDYPNESAGTADWLIGEDCWLANTALRDMRNPSNISTVGASFRQPSRYHGSFWNTSGLDNGGVHHNDGPHNFVYYLLSDGGSGTNDGLPYSVTGIGRLNAARIAARALTAYGTASDGFASIRDRWISAATDLFPSNVPNVRAAFDAIGIRAVPATITQDFEGTLLPAMPAGFTSSGNANWFTTATTSRNGARSMQAGAIGHSQTSTVETTVNAPVGGAILTFFARVSSEPYFDYLIFSVNGTEQTRWSGNVGWTSYCVALSEGANTLRWTYSKDTNTVSGSDTAWVDAITIASAPTAPGGLGATASGSTQINLAWTDNSNNETGFSIERQIGSGAFVEIATAAAGATTFGDNTVGGATTYTYRLRAVNAGEYSAYSASASATTSAGPPASPTGLGAVANSQTQIALAWTDNAGDETSFRVERGAAAGGPFSEIGSTSANVTTFIDNGGSTSTTFFYRVRARNGNGDSPYTNVASATTQAAPTTTTLTTTTAPAASSGGSSGGGSTDSTGGGGGGCFIATAAYGSYLDPHVVGLRRFRDTVLMPTAAGRMFVTAYYRLSPPLAAMIAQSTPLRFATRLALTPMVMAVEYPALLCLGMLVALSLRMRRRAIR